MRVFWAAKMDAGMEKECSALGGLFQTIMNDMKVSPSYIKMIHRCFDLPQRRGWFGVLLGQMHGISYFPAVLEGWQQFCGWPAADTCDVCLCPLQFTICVSGCVRSSASLKDGGAFLCEISGNISLF